MYLTRNINLRIVETYIHVGTYVLRTPAILSHHAIHEHGLHTRIAY